MTLGPIRLSSDDLQQCIHCGMCLEACPTYRITGLETESPRGRIHLMGALAAGRIEPEPQTLIHLDRCLACRACEAVCPSGVPYGRLIETTRAELALRARAKDEGLKGKVRDLLLRGVMSRPRVLDVVARVGSLYERLGIRWLLHRTRLVRLLPDGLRRLESLYPPFARPRYKAPTRPAQPTARVALLMGCVMRVAYGDVHSATARVLSSQGVEIVEVAGQTCCGALHAHAGDAEESRRLAQQNIAAFERADIEAIVVNAAGCGAHLKGYAHMFHDDPEWAERAQAFQSKTRDVTEYLAAVVTEESVGSLPMRITYQDPCHLVHAQGIRSQPRQLLGKVRDLELVEMPNADVCCGSAGYYNLAQPEYADRLLETKLDDLLTTAPEAVVTANPGCMLQIQAGLRERGKNIEVLHVVEVLDRAMRS